VDFEDYIPLTAAGGGHSRADWGNWANRQLRDQNGDDAGEWIEMGRGSRFRYQKADGSIGTGTATYVGFSDIPNHGRFYVTGVDGIEEGVYDLDAGAVDPVKFYFAEGTKVGDYLENYYRSIGRNLDDLDVPSKLPVIDFSKLTPSQLTQEEANEMATENRMPPPLNLDEELKSRTESAKTASELKEGDIVFDETLKRYGSVEVAEPSPDGSGNIDTVVRWSNNQVQELNNLPADQEVKVWSEEQDGEPTVSRRKREGVPEEDVAAIRARADIAEVIGRYTKVTPAGAGKFKAICPFHDDTSPSLTIDSKKGLYKCFVDGKSGDVFQFIRDVENVSFTEAVRKVADIIGYRIEEKQADAKPSKAAKPRTKLASELTPGDQIIVDGETKNVTEVEKTLKVWATTELGKEVEVFYEYDEDLKNSLDENEDGDLQFEDEDYGLITVETYLPITRVTTKEDEDQLEFTAEEKVNFISTGTEDTAGVAPKPTKTDLEKQRYEEALANGAKRNLASLNYGDVIINSKNVEFIVISKKPTTNPNTGVKGETLTLQDPDGKIVELFAPRDMMIRVKVKPGKASKQQPYKLDNVFAKPSVPDPNKKERTEDSDSEDQGEEDSDRPRSEPGENQKRFDELEKGDRILYGKKKTPHTYVGARAIQDLEGNLLGYQPVLVNEATGTEFLGDIVDGDFIVDMAPAAATTAETQSQGQSGGKTEGKPRSKEKQPDAPTNADPGSSGKLDNKVSYQVLDSGRAVYFKFGVDLKNHKSRNDRVKKAIEGLSKVLGVVLFYRYDGSGKVFVDKEGNKRDFSDPNFNQQGYVLEVLPGEKDSPNSLLTKALKAIHAELAKPKEVEEEVVEGQAFSGSKGSKGTIAGGVSYSISDAGAMTLSGDVPGGIEGLSDHLDDVFPDGNVNLDPDGYPPTIYAFPSDVAKDNELRIQVLNEIKKYIESKTGTPTESTQPVETQQSQTTGDPLKRSYDVVQAAQEFFLSQLSSPEAIAYLESRKISVETAKKLGVGYAPKNKNALFNHLASLGFTTEEMLSVFLIGQNDDGSVRSNFLSRIMFPFVDSQGRTTGFTGRDVTNSAANKYMLSKGSSPEDPKNKSVFKKSESIFNLYNAAEAAKSSGQLIIVEGQFDALAYREAGFENVIAISGSDIKQSQIDMIRDAVGEDVDIVLGYDSDAAGKKATEKSHELFTQAGYRTYIANDPESEKDPADILADLGSEALKNVILNKKRIGGVTNEQLQEFSRLVTENPGAFSSEKLTELMQSISESSEETAEILINDLKEEIEIAPLRNELNTLIDQAVKNGVILELERSKIDFKITTADNKKQALKDAIEKLKEKLKKVAPPAEKATPPAKKAVITEAQRDSINKRFGMGIFTQEQIDAIVAILDNPNLTPNDLNRVIQTINVAENIWRMDQGWTLDPERGIFLQLVPVIDLGVSPMDVFNRRKTYKPTKDINGKPLEEGGKSEKRKYTVSSTTHTSDLQPGDFIRSGIYFNDGRSTHWPEYDDDVVGKTVQSANFVDGVEPFVEVLFTDGSSARLPASLKFPTYEIDVAREEEFPEEPDYETNGSSYFSWLELGISIGFLTKEQIEIGKDRYFKDVLIPFLESKKWNKNLNTSRLLQSVIELPKDKLDFLDKDQTLVHLVIELAIKKLLNADKKYKTNQDLLKDITAEVYNDIFSTFDLSFKQNLSNQDDFTDFVSKFLINNPKLTEGLLETTATSPTDTSEEESGSESDQDIDDRISELLKIASDHLAKGEYKEAYEAFIKASNLYHFDVEDSSEKVEPSEEDIAELEETRKNKSELEKKAEEGDEDAAFDLWGLATEDDDEEAAEKWARKLSEIDPSDLSYKEMLADALFNLDRLDEAESIYRDIIEKEKELIGTVDENGDEYIETDAINGLAELLASKGLYEEAARLLAEDFDGWDDEEEEEEAVVEEGRRLNDPAVPSNLGTKTGTNVLPQTGDNYNPDGTSAYAPSTGPIRGSKFRAMVSEAYRRGGWKGVKDLIKRSNVVSFDTETTGIEDYDGQLKPGNRLVQLGASRVNKDGKTETFNIYINPETGVIMSDWSKDNLLRPELDENGKPTGNYIKIEKDWLQQQADEKTALEDFIKFLGDDVVLLGHNLNFDISVLQDALDRHGLSINAIGSIDTMDFAGYSLPTYNPTGKTKSGKDSKDGIVLEGPRRASPEVKPEDLDPNNPLHFQASKKLGDVLQYFGLEPTGWHRADADAQDAYRILENIVDWLINNPGKESSNPLGIKALEFEKINSVADREIGNYLRAIGSGQPATSRQTSLNPVDKNGKPSPGFATDLRKLDISEEEIRNILSSMSGMTRGQAGDYIASILSDIRSGKPADIKKALQEAKYTKKSTSPGNTIPNATSQEQSSVEHEVQKRASDLNVGDKVRREDSDVYGIIKSIDKSIAGIVNLTIAYEDGETVEMSIRPSKKVAVYEQDNPKDSNTPEPADESDAPTPSESPDQNPTEATPPAAVEEDAESAEPNILDEYNKIVELVEYGLKNIPSSIEKFSSEEIDKIVESLFQKLIDSGLFNVEVFNKIYGLMATKMNSNASYNGGDWLPFIRKSELESIFSEIAKDSTQEQEREQEQGVTVDISSYPVQQREGIREFTEILDRLNSLEGKTPKIRVVESGSQPKLVERTPKFIEAFASKEDIEKALTDLGISKFKARRIAKKLERLDGTKEYFTELRKINEDLAKEERNKKSFKNIEKVIDFGEFLRKRGTPEGYDLYLSEDPRDIAKLARERALYKAWEKSLKNRKPIKTITDGNISVTFSSDEADHAERILDSAKKIQEQFPLDGRKLKVSFYSPEQLAILDIGEIVGASIVTDKLAHIAITSSIAGREEMDPRRNGSGKKDFSDLFVLIHEYGHVYDEIALNGKTREKFAEQFKDSDITTYAGEDLSENFAEHFMDLAYSGLKGKKPVSAEFKKFMKDGKASGDIDPTVLKKSGPFFGDAIVSPRRVSASVQGVTLRGVGEKVDSELQNFENATSTGNGTSGEWLKGTDDEAGYIPDLSKDDIAKNYIDQIPELGVSLEEFNSSNDEDKASILNKVREILQPLVDAQRQDSRKYRVLTVDGTNTHIRFKEGSVDAETLSDLIYEVKSLNNFSDMGGMPVIITLAENNTFTVKGELFNGDDAGINLMNSSGTQMHVVLNTKFAKEKPESDPNNKYISSSKTTMLETLVHEYLGHGLAKIFFGQKYLNKQEDNERFIEFKSKFPLPEDERDHPVSAYGGTSHEESFAEYVRAAYDIVTFGKSPTDYPEIRKFLNFIDSRMETYGPVIKTDKAGSDLALVDRRVVSNTPSFPQPTKYAGELAAVDTFNSRETHYSNNLDPYGRPVGADFTETLETAYGLVSKARKEYYRNPSDDNFIAFASLASVLNEMYNSRYFNYPKNTPRYTDESVLNSIKTSENASSIRRWQTSKPFVPLRYPTTSEKFNNEFTVSSYTDVNGDVYQVVFVSSKPAIDEDGVSESVHVFASKPNQPLSYFVDSGTSFNDLVKKSAGQMKITNFEQGSLLAATDLEIQSTYVQGKNRRKGLATAMLAVAKQNSRKNLRFSKQQTIQEDSWARSVDQNSENHLGMPAFTDPDGGLRPADRSPLTSPAVGYRKTDWADDEAPRINYNSDARDEAEEEAFDAFSSRYLSSSVFSGSRDYYSSNGGGMGLDQSVVGAVKVSTLKSMAGNAVDEVRVLELMEKIKSGEGFKDPVIVYYDPETKDTIVADGNHHVEASSRLGLDFVPTRVIVGKFDSSDFVSPKKATRDWKNNPFKSKDWPRHVNPYFVFGAEDLISYADNDVVIDRRRIISSVGKVEPNEISKLIGRYVLDNVTGQIYMVYDEHYDSENKPTGKIVVERFVGTFDKLGSVIETRVDGKLTFNKNGKLLLKKGQANFTNEYNDIRQYELEIRDLKDFQDVTESFVKSGGKPLVVTESMFFIWSGRDIKGKINKFLSPGKVQLAELIGIDGDGEREYRLHEVPVTELGLIQGQRESLGEEVVDHSQDMLAGKVLYALVIENAKTLLADGFIDRSFFEAILETVKGKFQTKSGVEDMLKSLDRLNRRRVRQKRAEVLEKKLATATTRRAVAVKSKVEETPKDSEKPVVIGRMTFLQLYKQTLEDKKNGVTRDPFADTKSPATEEGTNPLSQPNIDAVSEAAIALAELTDINSDFGFTQQEGIAIMLALKTSTNAGAKDIIEQLRARVLAKRMEAGQPIGDLRIPEKIDSDELKKYTPKVNMDGTPYTGPKGTIFDETTIYGEPEQIIDYIKYVLSPGDFLAITGGAGTGKTTLIRQLLEKSKGINVATVTPTGKTAMQIAAASTVHSLFGFSKDTGLSEEFDIEVEDTDENGNPVLIKYDSREQFVAKYAGTKKGKALATLDLLVIDEVSMINANLMDAMDLALRVAKGKLGIPFGGVKVVAFGDDNQLPPVEYWNPDSNRTKKLNDDLKKGKLDKEEYDAKMRVELAKKAKHEYMLLDYDSYRWFDSKVFAQQKPLHKRLTTIYRQKDDVAFAELLGRLANATEISQDDIDLINSRYGGIPKDPNALRIVLTNARADLINKKAIEKLQQSGAPSAEFIGEFNGIRRVFADDDLFAPEKITYFVGEKVVFTVNDGKDLQDQVGYRGDRRWSNGTEGTVVGFDEDTGLPVVEIKVGDEVVKVVVGKANSAATGADTETVFDEISGSPQERFSTKTEADYTQIPMIPAYAITVHKAQGMTIQGEAIVDFLDEDGEIAKPFASGQAYVALSRFTKLENMYLTRKITASDFMSDDNVTRYYKTVEDIEIGESVKNAKKEMKEKEQQEKPAQPVDDDPTVDRRVVKDSGDKILLDTISKADVKSAKKILEHKTKPVSGLPSDWGTTDLADYFFSQFGYGEESSFKQNLNAIMSEKPENLHLEQKLLVSLIAAHGKADIYTHAETGTTIKRHLKGGLFNNKDASDNEVLLATAAHKRILDSGLVIDGGRMDINLRDLSYIGEPASGLYSASKDEINIDTSQVYGWKLQGDRNKMSEGDQFAYVVAHEYAHALDNKLAENGERLSVVLENLIKSGMQNRAKEILRMYALTSPPEYFAESYAGLILQSVLNQLGYSDKTAMDETLIDEVKNRINSRNSQ